MRIQIADGYGISRIIKGGWHLAGDHGVIDPEQAVHDMAAFVEAGTILGVELLELEHEQQLLDGCLAHSSMTWR